MKKIIFILILFLILCIWIIYKKNNQDEIQSKVIQSFLNINTPNSLNPSLQTIKIWLSSIYPDFSETLAIYIHELWTLSELEKVQKMDIKTQKYILQTLLKK